MGLTIGVDIGGTKIAAGVVDEEGNILSTHKVPTPGTAEGIVDAIAAAVDGARAGHEIVGVGIGAAGYVNRQRSTVYFAPNIDWRQEPLKEKVEARVGLPVVVENDANAAAWANTSSVPARATATSSASRSAPASAAASSSATSCAADTSGWPPSSGTSGWCRTGCCAAAVHRAAGSSTRRAVPSCATPSSGRTRPRVRGGASLARRRHPEGIEGKHISMAARQGDPVAVDSYRELARWAGAGLADLASLFDPSAFIVGGGLSDEGELVLDPIRKSYKRWLVGGNWRPVADVIAAQLGNKAGMVGAADLAREPDPIM